MWLYQNVTGSTASTVYRLLGVGTFIIHWWGQTSGSFTPQFSPDQGTTWKDYDIGAITDASGDLESTDGGVLFRLNGSSIGGGIYATIRGVNVQPATLP